LDRRAGLALEGSDGFATGRAAVRCGDALWSPGRLDARGALTSVAPERNKHRLTVDGVNNDLASTATKPK
jgi:hypothetical protein